MEALHIHKENLYLMHHPNNWPNIELTVCKMVHPANSFLDLAFLVPDNPAAGWKPPKFVIFFDNIAESVCTTRFLHIHLPVEFHGMIKWFNSEMLAEYRVKNCEDLKDGRTWGLLSTNSFEMICHQVPCVVLATHWGFYRALTCWILSGSFNGEWHVICAHSGNILAKQGRIWHYVEWPSCSLSQSISMLIKNGSQRYWNKRKGKQSPTWRKVKVWKESGGLNLHQNQAKPPHPPTKPLVEHVTHEEEDLGGARAPELLYNQLPDNASSHQGGQKKKVIEPVIDDFINAKTRPHLQCFQKPVCIYFGRTLPFPMYSSRILWNSMEFSAAPDTWFHLLQ